MTLPPPPSSCLLPQHHLLTDASGYLVVVAPGAVWLADCGRQLFGGEPVAAVAEVGHPCADGVISSKHTSVHWRAGHTAWHSCGQQEDECRHTFMRSTRHMLERFAETPGKHRHGVQSNIHWIVTFWWASTRACTSPALRLQPHKWFWVFVSQLTQTAICFHQLCFFLC